MRKINLDCCPSVQGADKGKLYTRAFQLVKKFKYNNKNINTLKKEFESKRSGLLNIY